MSHDPHALPAGTVIAGYRIVRTLGAGGFGITYEGESPVTGRRVAIKEFFPRGIASRKGATEIIYAERDSELVSWALKRFESSTTEQCRLKHPNIVEVFHYLADNDTGYMFMDYVEGSTFEHWLRDRPNLPTLDEIRPILEPVIDALDYLHNMNFIHRDIAPDNIMITADGRPVIIDFGAIKVIENRTLLQAKTVHSFMVGKQHYSPPEQTREGEALDARADIYALGAVFYRALTGKPPADTEERARKIAFGEGDSLIPLSVAAPHVPEPFAQAIEKALSFRASERQSSIEELRLALGWQGMPASNAATMPVIRGVPNPLPNPSHVSASSAQIAKSKQSSAGRWAAIAAALVLLVVGSAFAMMSFRSSEPQVAVLTPAKNETPPRQVQTQEQQTQQPQAPAGQQQNAPAQSPQQVAVAEPKAEVKTDAPSKQDVQVQERKIDALVPPPPPVDPQADARRDFEIAQKIDTAEAYELFLSRHPEGFYATLARAQQTKLAAIEQQRVQQEQLRIQQALTRNVIAELQRAGCGPDRSDGEWNDAARKSLELYNRHAKTKFDDEPNEELLHALKERDGRVCPLVCGRGFVARNNACVPIPQQVQQRPQQQRPQQQPQQQQQAPQLPRGTVCVRGICVGN
ncbi:MAG: serine/threonine protein kinase [Xanthobacteraceae bacterium]|jgi:serine/threonine protein kinase